MIITRFNLFLIFGFCSSQIGLDQQKDLYKLPSVPEGPVTFGAYYSRLKDGEFTAAQILRVVSNQ